MNPRIRLRRGFTLIELTLSTAIAAVVIGASLAMFNAVDRADRKLAGRYDRAADIERTRRAFQNAFASIATSERPRPRTQNPDGGPASGLPGAGSQPRVDPKAGLNSEGAAEQPSGDSVPPPPPPRVTLAPDTGPDSDPFLSAAGIQRLEMVLTTSPVPVFKREGSDEARVAAAEAEAEDNRVDPSASGGARAVRGAFVLRPQQSRPGPDLRADLADRPLMELWWQPLPPAQEDPDAEPLPMSLSAGYPTMLTSDVLRCTWRMYREGQWTEQHAATWRDELPAYVEVQMDFANGQSTKWLMEIDSVSMAEVTLNEEGAEAASGAAGSGGRNSGRDSGRNTGGTRSGGSGSVAGPKRQFRE
ncbi:MAG: prepilin-type N-terminal cleavage/methylation domain-containing protein [Tepidisphaera sp.]